MLIEDEPALQRAVRRALESFGYSVSVASDPNECLRLSADAAPVDVILSDVNLPGMDGPQLYRELRRRGVNAPFIFLSGESERVFRSRYGMSDVAFVSKPWTLDELRDAVQMALGKP